MKKLFLMVAFAGFLTSVSAPAFSMISSEVAKTITTGDDKEKKKKKSKKGSSCCSKEAKAACGPKSDVKSCGPKSDVKAAPAPKSESAK